MEGYIFSFNSEDQEGILYGTNGIPYFFKAVDVDSPAKIASQVKVEFSSFTDGSQRKVARMIKIQESKSFKSKTPHSSAAQNAGNSSGVAGSSNNYADQIGFQGTRGHGFAAEQANHLHDKFTGKDAHLVGSDNKKNGPDRLVNDVYIQTKYCSTGSKCISECFENESFKYMQNGKPMQIEVPADKYESALQAMEERIKKGQVPGILDPSQAKDIVRKGSFTYEQAKNIAKFGTIDSLKFDALNGIEFSAKSMGISSAISFAVNIWRGESFEVAMENSVKEGLKVFGTTFISNILTSQIGKTGIDKTLRPVTDALVKKMGSNAASKIALGLSNKAIYGGAALNHVSKLLRGNIVTGVVTTTVLSSADITRTIQGKMSGPQLFKNIANTAAGVAGGTAGWAAGATAGAALGSIVPGVGNAVGAVVGAVAGSLLGGGASSKVTKTILDKFIEDDAPKMLEIFNTVFSQLAFDYLLNENEINKVSDLIKDKYNMGKELREMYASTDKHSYARGIIRPAIKTVASNRKKITLPNEADIIQELAHLVEVSSSADASNEDLYEYITCSSCGAKKRIPIVKLLENQNGNLKCGKCKTPLELTSPALAGAATL
ncbi:hypothetical protein [Neobacillus niacini]|uniref:hypothetical protein n=1 Tax=Neobacillus niacini TaxID=86668 RepID=UPI003982F177